MSHLCTDFTIRSFFIRKHSRCRNSSVNCHPDNSILGALSLPPLHSGGGSAWRKDEVKSTRLPGSRACGRSQWARGAQASPARPHHLRGHTE
ncbi:hypothetical protein VULLAG_LOCUS297 [Vulpes lagopus]